MGPPRGEGDSVPGLGRLHYGRGRWPRLAVVWAITRPVLRSQLVWMVWLTFGASGVVGGVCQPTFRRRGSRRPEGAAVSTDAGCAQAIVRLRGLQEVETVLDDTWYSRDLPVLTAIAEKLERGSSPVDTEQLIDELGLTRQDLTAALRALDVEYLIVRWPARITFRRSDPSIVVERITARAREAVGLWPSAEARQTLPRRSGHDQE
jgi:hypothetical protein